MRYNIESLKGVETQGLLRETLLRDELASRPAGNDVLQIEGRLKSSLDAAMRIRGCRLFQFPGTTM